MNKRSNFMRIMSLFLMFMLMSSSLIQAETVDFGVPSIWTETYTISYSGGSKIFTVLWCDLNDEKLRIETVIADGEIGGSQTLGQLVTSASDLDGDAFAGISGTSYNFQDDQQPNGTIIVDGIVKHVNNGGTIFTINGDNTPYFIQAEIRLDGALEGLYDSPNAFTTSNVNHFDSNSQNIQFFTDEYAGPTPSHNYTSVQVSGDVISTISIGGFDIPEEGYMLLIPESLMNEEFGVGTPIEYNFSYYWDDFDSSTTNTATTAFDSVRSGIGAGPYLVKDSNIQTNFSNENMVNKYYSNSSSINRSFVGVNKNGYLGMASVEDVTTSQLAEIAKKVGMVNAMQLDYGPSSTLYIDKASTTITDIEVSNALVIKRLYEDPINIELNGQKVFFDSEPYLNKDFDRTLVPLRKIAEALGAEVSWDEETSSVNIDRYDTLLALQLDSTTVYVNGIPNEMELPMTIRNERSYVPVRFITEYFGGTVDWDGTTSTVILNISTTDGLFNSADEYLADGLNNEALGIYKDVLELEPTNFRAIKAIANMYDSILNDYVNAVKWNKKLIRIKPDDLGGLKALGSQYATVGFSDDSITWYLEYLKYDANNAEVNYNIATQYASFQRGDIQNAKKYFQLAIDYGISDTALDFATNYLNNH